MKQSYPGLNIQFPISELIANGQKTIETRSYPLPKKFIGRPIALIETPGPAGNFKARITAIIQFDESFEYKTAREFYADEKRHRVTKDSPWRWRSDSKKFGWPVRVLKRLNRPTAPPEKRGIVFSKSCEI